MAGPSKTQRETVEAVAAVRRRTRYGARAAVFNAIALAIGAAALMLAVLIGAARAQDGDERPVILALGDSLTAGYGLSKAESFPSVLEDALAEAGRPAEVINAGVSGDTTKGGLSRVDWLLTEDPDVVLLELGSNDGLRALDPQQTYENLAAIIEKSQQAGAHVLLAGMLAPPNLGRDYGREFNAVFPRLADEYDVTFYPFFLEGVAAEPQLNQSDGMHPNADGVEVIVDNILPTVIEALDAAAGTGEGAAG
ncbi:MAG: arylesterase [Marivibrio sp.]|uniref:arylesterase n=1 Tax=Marivibrio sp. TaxID=2039719 RepID=UPI0032EEEFEE